MPFSMVPVRLMASDMQPEHLDQLSLAERIKRCRHQVASWYRLIDLYTYITWLKIQILDSGSLDF